MITKGDLETIKKETEKLLGFLGAHGTFEALVKEDTQTIHIQVRVEDPKLFIGEKGQTLFEIQHLVKLIIRKKLPDTALYYISLDMNDYKRNKEEYLQDLARTTADEVSLLKKAKELPPMPSGERRIIHAALGERTDVVSESIGEEPDRRVVIKIKS
ncbi:MAG TPA: R3H domain-containing nucleic acid-binding protein [Candidatus Paceibacterota bacterium]